MTIRIDDLNSTVNPERDHEFPAMRDGQTVKLRLKQVLAVGGESDPQALKDFSNVDSTTGRAALGLGTAALANVGSNEDDVPVLEGDGTLSDARLPLTQSGKTFTGNIVLTTGVSVLVGTQYQSNGNSETDELFVGQGSDGDAFIFQRANSNMRFGTDNTERMRLDGSGNLLIGQNSETSPGINNTVTGFSYLSSSDLLCLSREAGRSLNVNRNTNGSTVELRRSGISVGSIAVTEITTSYNTSSDYRMKNDIVDLTGSGAFIDALKPRRWVWKTNGDPGAGFIAHEAQEVTPSSVTGEKDAVDENGNPEMQAMQASSSEIMANIIAELKSLRARVAELELLSA